MPLPHPSATESREDYVSRFMADAHARAEFPDEKQRAAVANNKWREISKSVLDAAARNKLKPGQFALPESESYPIEDEAHARNALARVSQHGSDEEKKRVRAAVKKKFPHIEVGEDVSKAAATHRMTDAIITRLSLCKQGKNGMRTILKEDGSFCIETLIKASEDENELLVVVYAPERPDDDGHVADADLIKSMCHEYNRDHRQLDIEHDGRVLKSSDAFVAESFIVAKGDERFAQWKDYENNDVGDLTGAWASVIKLEHPVLQKAYKNGDLDGVSMFGKAALERVDRSAASKRVAERLGKARDTHKEIDMDKTELKEMFSSFKAEIVTLVKSMVPEKPAEKPEDKEHKPKLTAPVFKGNPAKAADLEQFEGEMRAYELNKALADGTLTADKVAELRKSVAAGQPSDKDAGIEDTDTPREKELKRELFKARKARNAPEGAASGADDMQNIAKANYDEGLAIAEIANERRGSAHGGMKVVPAKS